MNGKGVAAAPAIAAAVPTVVTCPAMLPICFKPLCLIILLLLAAVMMGCRPATESVPQPTRGAQSLSGESPANQPDLGTMPGQPQHPKLDIYLNKVVAEGRVPERRYGNDEGIIPDQSVGVSVYLSGNAEIVVAWLESQGISRRYADSRDEISPCRLATLSYCIAPGYDGYSIIAYLPLDLLAPLSRQPGVARVRAIEPYPKLSRSLRELAAEFDGPLAPIWGNTPRAELRPATQSVEICQSTPTDAVVAWLESKGVYADRPPGGDPMTTVRMSRLATRIAERRDTVAANPLLDPIAASHLATQLAPQPEPRYAILEATIPVSLLGDLSLRPGVDWVNRGGGCAGIEEIGARGTPCYTPEECQPPFAVIRGLGNSETFLLFTNVAHPPGVRVSVNYAEDTGKLAIGSCWDGNRSTFVGHGDSVAIAGCAAGAAQVRLYRDGELLKSYDLAVKSLLN